MAGAYWNNRYRVSECFVDVVKRWTRMSYGTGSKDNFLLELKDYQSGLNNVKNHLLSNIFSFRSKLEEKFPKLP